MSMVQILAEQRRLIVLQLLDQAPGRRVNEMILVSATKHLLGQISHDEMRANLGWLEQHGLIRVERIPNGSGGEIWIAILQAAGLDVVQGTPHEGVARPEPV